MTTQIEHDLASFIANEQFIKHIWHQLQTHYNLQTNLTCPILNYVHNRGEFTRSIQTRKVKVREVKGKFVCWRTTRATPKFVLQCKLGQYLFTPSVMLHFIRQLLSAFPTNLNQQSALPNCKAPT